MKLVILIALATMLFSGCATIIRPNSTVVIDSEPSGIFCEVKEVSGVKIINGTTPFKAKLENSEDMMVYCENGLSKETEQGLNPWLWGDVALLSILGLVIDLATDNHTEHRDTFVGDMNASNDYVIEKES